MKPKFLQEYIQVHNTFCYICSNFPSFHSPCKERGSGSRRERLPYIMSGVLTGAPPSHRLLNLHNQVCCFQPCFQLSCTEGNLLALILESLEITLHDESSQWFSWTLFNKLLNLHCHCNKSRCPMQLVESTVLLTMGGNQAGVSVSEENFKNLTQICRKLVCWLNTLQNHNCYF